MEEAHVRKLARQQKDPFRQCLALTLLDLVSMMLPGWGLEISFDTDISQVKY